MSDWKFIPIKILDASEPYRMICYVDDFEKLREKLIEDIQMDLYSKNGMEFLHGVVEIINKRFGVV